MKRINELIQNYNLIRIYHHIRPDGDALGSAYALKELIQENYQEKQIELITDEEITIDFIEDRRQWIIDKEIKEDFLAIIVDVSAHDRIAGTTWKEAKEILVIDHHQSTENNNIKEIRSDVIEFVNSELPANAAWLTEIANQLNWKINKQAAKYLAIGFMTDTISRIDIATRGNALKYFEKMFEILGQEEIERIQRKIFAKPIEYKEIISYILAKTIIENHYSYYLLERQEYKSKGFELKDVREKINIISNIGNNEIWFTIIENESNKYLVELRSKSNVEVNKIATKFGGGGHKQAAGCTLNNKEEVEQLINYIKERKYEH